MAPITYSGALQPKKKAELQEIAIALKLGDQGTKEDLQNRIKKHLDHNQATLEEEPAFAGLFGRRKRSVQPQVPPPSSRFAPSSEPTVDVKQSPTRSTRRITALDPIRESTPVADLRDVSTMLKKNPFDNPDISPSTSTPVSRRALMLGTPSSLPPLPPSPSSVVEHDTSSRSILEHVQAPDVETIVEMVRSREETVLRSGSDVLIAFRAFLSNSRNIWSLTAIFELLFILSAIIPWKSVQIPLSPTSESTPKFSLFYPPIATFQTSTFWIVLAHWAIPTLLIPALFGTFISFSPSQHTPNPSQGSSSCPPDPSRHQTNIPDIPFDPLTASIIRLAAQIAYPFSSLASGATEGLDVLGFRWRVLNASVGVAFAFAEAIAGAPAIFARHIGEQAQSGNEKRQLVDEPQRRALMGEDTVVEEID